MSRLDEKHIRDIIAKMDEEKRAAAEHKVATDLAEAEAARDRRRAELEAKGYDWQGRGCITWSVAYTLYLGLAIVVLCVTALVAFENWQKNASLDTIFDRATKTCIIATFFCLWPAFFVSALYYGLEC